MCREPEGCVERERMFGENCVVKGEGDRWEISCSGELAAR